MLAEGRRRGVDPVVDAGEPERDRRVPAYPDHGMLGVLVVPAGDVLRVLRREAGVDRRRRGDARGDQQVDRLVEIGLGGPGRELLVEEIVRPTTAGVGPQRWIRGPVRTPEGVNHRRPLAVGRHRDRQPPFRGVGRVDALRCGPRAATAFARQRVAVPRPLDDELGRDVQRGFEHGRLDQRADAGAVAQLERDQRPDHRVHAAVRIARATLDARLVVDVAGQPRQPGDLFHGLREPRPVAPRTIEAERGHAHHHRARVGRVHDVPPEVELVDHARCVVLDHDVDLLDQAQRERSALGPRQVEGEVALVGVRGVEQRAVLPPTVTIHADAAGEPHAVGPGDRLDVDDVGPERGEHGRRRRPRPPRGEVEHLAPVQGQLGAVLGGRLGRARDDLPGVLTQPGRRPRRRRHLAVDPPRSARYPERARRIVHQ